MKWSSPSLALILCLILLTSSAFAIPALGAVGDTLSVSDASGLPGDAGIALSVSLSNVTSIKGLHFKIVDQPNKLKVASMTLGARAAGFRFDTTSVAGGIWVLMIPNASANPPIAPGQRGPILNITVDVSASAAGGTSATVSLDSVSLGDDAAPSQPVTYVGESGVFWFGQKGDLNYSGGVDLFDVLRMIDIAIQRPPSPTDYERWAGDFNDDGAVGIDDIGQAIDLAVAPPLSISLPEGADTRSAVGNVVIGISQLPPSTTGTVGIPIRVRSSAPVSGIQLALKVDPEKYKVTMPKTTQLTSKMVLASKLRGDELHVLVCSLSGETIPPGEYDILTLPVTILSPLKEAESIKIEGALAGTEGARRLEVTHSEAEFGPTVVPKSFALLQNTPNPFNSSTLITYDIPSLSGPVDVKLAIFNVHGQLVCTLEHTQREAGRYTVSWDSRDTHGNHVSSGVYFYKLIADGITLTKKLAVLR